MGSGKDGLGREGSLGKLVPDPVVPLGFEFKGERYGSLSAIAKSVTGSHMNGYRFFGLLKEAA